MPFAAPRSLPFLSRRMPCAFPHVPLCRHPGAHHIGSQGQTDERRDNRGAHASNRGARHGACSGAPFPPCRHVARHGHVNVRQASKIARLDVSSRVRPDRCAPDQVKLSSLPVSPMLQTTQFQDLSDTPGAYDSGVREDRKRVRARVGVPSSQVRRMIITCLGICRAPSDQACLQSGRC